MVGTIFGFIAGEEGGEMWLKLGSRSKDKLHAFPGVLSFRSNAFTALHPPNYQRAPLRLTQKPEEPVNEMNRMLLFE
jgi:hypothetical protein